MLPLKSSAPRTSISSSPRRSRAISSVATEVPMSWATMKTGPGPERRTSSSAASACQASV